MYKNLIPTSQRTQPFRIIKMYQLLLLRETVAHPENHTRHKYIVRNAELISDSAGGTYNYHRTLKC